MLFNRILPAVVALLPALASASAPASSVIDLTPTNFDEVVLKSGKPALVEFFAPWCGHCKNLAPVYEELATGFQHAAGKVSVAKVDADEHKSLGKRFGVTGFPTLKWFDGKSDKPEDYKGGRDLESLTKFISEKTAVKPKTKGKLPSAVTYLDDQSFKQKVGKDQDVLVAFTAPWCGRKSFCYMNTEQLLTMSRLQDPRPRLGGSCQHLCQRAQRSGRQGRRRSRERKGPC